MAGVEAERIWIADGAPGGPPFAGEAVFRGKRFADSKTELRGNLDVLNLTAPERVAAMHKEYIDAGADIIRTNTYRCDSLTQSCYGLEDVADEMALQGARIARKVADAENQLLTEEHDKARSQEGLDLPLRHIRVAGTLGTTTVSLDIAPRFPGSPTAKDVSKAYYRQLTALAEGGVDCFWLGRVGDAATLRAFLEAYARMGRKRLPLIVTVDPIDRYGNPISPRALQEYAALLQGITLVGFGFEGPCKIDWMRSLLKASSKLFSCRRVCCPDVTVQSGHSNYEDRPEQAAHTLLKISEGGLVGISACGAGTTPAHVCATATALTEETTQVQQRVDAPKQRHAILVTPRGERQGRDAWLTATSLTLAGYSVDGPKIITGFAQTARMKADLFCLCGWSPELLWQAEMLCDELAKAGSDTPLMVTGRGSDSLHTVLQLVPRYANVFHAATADDVQSKALRLSRDPERFRKDESLGHHLTEVRDQLRHAGYGERPGKGQSVFRSRHYIDAKDGVPSPSTFQIGSKPIFDAIDWKGVLRELNPSRSKRNKRLPRGGKEKSMLDSIRSKTEALLRDQQVKALVQTRFCQAFSEDDCLQARFPDGSTVSLPMLRQEKVSQINGLRGKFSLADFVPHITQAFMGPVGFYSVRLSGTHGPVDDKVRIALRNGICNSLSAILRQQGKVPADFSVSIVEAGTPTCPDRSLRKDIASILTPGFEPEDGTAYGLVTIQRYPARFETGQISPAQLVLYAARRGVSETIVRQSLCIPAEAESTEE